MSIKEKVFPFDPEGLSSQHGRHRAGDLWFFFVGQYIQQKGKNYEMLSNLFCCRLVLFFTGYCWDMVFPVNKKIWTSSYVLYTTGLAIMTLGTLIYLIEFKRKEKAPGAVSLMYLGKNHCSYLY